MSIYPSGAARFEEISDRISRVINVSKSLPSWPFRAQGGNVDICQYVNVTGGRFGRVLEELSRFHEDKEVSLLCLDPDPLRYRKKYGYYTAFTLPSESIAERYWEVLSLEPGDESAGALIDIADKVAISGDSGRWAVWAERSWQLAVVMTQHVNGPWVLDDVNFAPLEEALWAYSEDYFDSRTWPKLRRQFLENFGTRDSLRLE